MRLEDLCAGDISALAELTILLAKRSASSTLTGMKTARLAAKNSLTGAVTIVGHMNKNNAVSLAKSTVRSTAYGAAVVSKKTAGITEATAKGVISSGKIVTKTVHQGIEKASKMIIELPKNILASIKNPREQIPILLSKMENLTMRSAAIGIYVMKKAMKLSPLHLFEMVFLYITRLLFYVILVTPIVIFILGWILWEVGLWINGIELMAFGAAAGILGPIIWYIVRYRGLKSLKAVSALMVKSASKPLRTIRRKIKRKKRNRKKERENMASDETIKHEHDGSIV